MESTDRVIELTRKIDGLMGEYEAIKAKAKAEDRLRTEDEKTRCIAIQKEVSDLTGERNLEQDEVDMRDSVNKSYRAPVRPALESEDNLQRMYPGLPAKEKRFSDMGEFVSAVIKSDPRVDGRVDKKLMRAATGMGESNPIDGGFLVQADQSARLIEPLFKENGDAILSRLNTTNVSGNGLTFNAIAETSRATTSWGGIAVYWLGEGDAKTPSQPALRKVELKLKKIAGLMYLTDELMEDAAALSSRIERGFQVALRSAIIKAIVSGSGSGQPLGLLNSTAKIAITGSGGAASIVTDDILNMRERLDPNAISPVWLYNPTCYKQLFQLQVGLGTAGALVSGQTIQSAGMQSMLGIPMVSCPWCSVLGTAGDLILTDLGQYEFIQKGGPQVAYSIHVKFIYDETAMRIVYRCDGQPAVISATTLEDGTTTASPIVTLATRS
jgi:HK97 family phage major capsid protein